MDHVEHFGKVALAIGPDCVEPSYLRDLSCGQFALAVALSLNQMIRASRNAFSWIRNRMSILVAHFFPVFFLGSLPEMFRVEAFRHVARMKNGKTVIDRSFRENIGEAMNSPEFPHKSNATITVATVKRPYEAFGRFSVSLNHFRDMCPCLGFHGRNGSTFLRIFKEPKYNEIMGMA